MSVKKRYEVVTAGFLGGDYYAAGAIVALHPVQAKYDLPPHGEMLREVPVDAPADVPAAVPAKKPASK